MNLSLYFSRQFKLKIQIQNSTHINELKKVDFAIFISLNDLICSLATIIYSLFGVIYMKRVTMYL